MRSLATSSKCTNLDSREVSEKSRKSLERVSQPKNICSSLKTPWRVYFFTLIMVRDCTLWKKYISMNSPQARLFKYLQEVLLWLEGCTFPHWIGLPADFSQGILQFVHTPHPMILKSAKGVNLNNGTKILWIRDVIYNQTWILKTELLFIQQHLVSFQTQILTKNNHCSQNWQMSW